MPRNACLAPLDRSRSDVAIGSDVGNRLGRAVPMHRFPFGRAKAATDRREPGTFRLSLESRPKRMDSSLDERLIEQARGGEERALSELFQRHQPRLVRMVELRLDPTLRRRLDP